MAEFDEEKFYNHKREAELWGYPVSYLAKWFLMGLIGTFTLTGLYLVFNYWVFIAFFVSVIPLSSFFYFKIKVDSVPVLSVNVSSLPDDQDYISLVFIPRKEFEKYTRSGSSDVRIFSQFGYPILIADDIDIETKKIMSPWMADFANFEFFKRKRAFVELKRKLNEEMISNVSMRSISSVIVAKKLAGVLQKYFDEFDKDILNINDVVSDVVRELENTLDGEDEKLIPGGEEDKLTG